MVVQRTDWNWHTFRQFSAPDQLAYFAFTVNVASGKSPNVEPFTLTGNVFYPRSYYAGLGYFSKFFGIAPEVSWLVVGLAVQLILVAMIGFVSISITKRPWTGLLSWMPLMVGTLSFVQGGDWILQFGSHAVAWGPFGTLFPLNGESFGIVIAGVANLILIYALVVSKKAWLRQLLLVIAFLLIGSLSSVQTYAFLTEIYLVGYSAALYGILRLSKRPQIVYAAFTSILLLALYFFGKEIAVSSNPIVVLLLGLVPALPGVISLLLKFPRQLLLPVIAVILTALPTVVSTLFGVINHDPFLSYRTLSSSNLGVPIFKGIISSLPVSIPLLLICLVGIRSKNLLLASAPVGLSIAWFILGTNDRWGANQEPYRLWIDSCAVIAFSVLPLFLWVLFPNKSNASEEIAKSFPKKYRRTAIYLTTVLFVLSFADFVSFHHAMGKLPLIQLAGPRELALKEVVGELDQQIVLTDLCIEPIIYKAVTAKAVVSVNLGMAWPERYKAMIKATENRADQITDFNLLKEADAQYILTDSACDPSLTSWIKQGISAVNSVKYPGGKFTLWKI